MTGPQDFPRGYWQPSLRLQLTVTILLALVVYFLAWFEVSHWRQIHPGDRNDWTSLLAFAIAIQFPWVVAILSYTATKKTVARLGAEAEAIRQLQTLEIFRVNMMYLMLVLILGTAVGFVR